jgi:hypothetical protein
MWTHFQYLDFKTFWMVGKEPNLHILYYSHFCLKTFKHYEILGFPKSKWENCLGCWVSLFHICENVFEL